MQSVASLNRRAVPVTGERRLPAGTQASGWYQVGWSWDFATETSHALRYFGRDLVIYRTASGALLMSDAMCPHLGAHMGHGGRVSGECLVCPFHGWEWNPDGTNARVPYGPRDTVRNRLRTYEVQEIDAHVVVWWDPQGRPPFLECKTRLVPSDADLYVPTAAEGLRFSGVTFSPQLPVENLVDFAHFKYVHRADEVGELDSFEELDGRFRTTISLEFGGGRPATWLTPDGPRLGLVINDVHSVGFFVSRFEVNEPGRADMILTTATTPIDDETSDMFITVMPRDAAIAEKWVTQEALQTTRDLNIWNHIVYLNSPPLVGAEVAAMRALREWTYQFYSPVTQSEES
jgi:3-ketosteroid 9alpha-monooxygenase subunit A